MIKNKKKNRKKIKKRIKKNINIKVVLVVQIIIVVVVVVVILNLKEKMLNLNILCNHLYHINLLCKLLKKHYLYLNIEINY